MTQIRMIMLIRILNDEVCNPGQIRTGDDKSCHSC
jgi:hypothetical protein